MTSMRRRRRSQAERTVHKHWRFTLTFASWKYAGVSFGPSHSRRKRGLKTVFWELGVDHE